MGADRRRRSIARRAAALAAASLLLSAATAAPPSETLATCDACHGPGGNSPVPQTPSLAAQPRLFIENQLVLIREGLRDVPEMKGALDGVGDAAISALATHYAAQPLTAAPAPADAEKVRRGEQLSRTLLCGTCHLADYRGQQQVPRLAGQNEAYLLHSMKQFRDDPGPGRDTIMASTLRGLSDLDLSSLAHYFARFGR